MRDYLPIGIILLCSIAACSCTSARNSGKGNLLEYLVVSRTREGIPAVEMNIGSYGGGGNFVSAFQANIGFQSLEELKVLTTNQSPQIRVLGAQCAISRGLTHEYVELREDNSVIALGKGTCFEKMTVGELVRRIEVDPLYLLRNACEVDVRIEEQGPTGLGMIQLDRIVYPSELLRAGIEGEVVARIESLDKGYRLDILKASHMEFSKAVREAVDRSKILTTGESGFSLQIDVKFRLRSWK